MQTQNFAIFDTETIGISPKLIYDLGLVIVNRSGGILFEQSWVIQEIATNGPMMLGAFYGHKMFSHYLPMLANGMMQMVPFADARESFNVAIARFNAKTVCAYNIGFDKRAIAETMEHCGIAGQFLQRKTNFADLWLASCQIICNTDKYRKFCRDNGMVSAAGNVRTSAESVYAYLTKNPQFVESHTALEDCEIEAEIFARIMQRKRKFPRNILNNQPWKIAQ